MTRAKLRRAPPPPPMPCITPEQAAWIETHLLFQAWNQDVHAETWRLVYAEGKRGAGPAEFARGALSLIAKGMEPPPGVIVTEDWIEEPPRPRPTSLTGLWR